MLFRKSGIPEEGELVLCTVTSVQFHSVFCDMDEYGKGGMIHISEVAPGRIRNIRDFVKEGKKVVCKVLKIHQEKGYIDLSLRRVNESEKRRKIEQIKREQNAEKILELAAGKLSVKTEQLYNDVYSKINKDYSSLYNFFENVIADDSLVDKYVDKKYSKVLQETINARIKPSEVEITGKMKLTTFASNGVDIVKECLKLAQELGNGKLNINYLGSGTYRFNIKAPDYKEAEKLMKNATESAIEFLSKHQGVAEFAREGA